MKASFIVTGSEKGYYNVDYISNEENIGNLTMMDLVGNKDEGVWPSFNLRPTYFDFSFYVQILEQCSLSIFSKRPSGVLGVETITIQGLLLAMYLSDTSLASCCCPGGKKSASSR